MRPLPTSEFLRFLADLTGRKASGVIVVERAGVETRVELKDGLAAAVEGGAIAETLGRLLVDEGALGRASYAAVLAQITAAESRLERKRFGETAIECGFLTADQLDEALQAQLRMKLARCIEQDRVRGRFDEGSILEPGPRWTIPLESCVIGALWRFDDPRLEAHLKPVRGRKLALTESIEITAKRLALWDDELPILEALVKGKVEDVLGDERFDAAPLVAALVATGLARAEGNDDGARAKVLRPHPTKRRWTHLPSARVSMRSFSDEEPPSRVRAEAILRRMSNERDEHRGTFANAPRSLAEVRLIAEAAFQLGLGHLSANTLDRASVEFARAADLVPSAAEYVLYARYADFAARQARATGFDPAQRAARTAALEVAVESALAQMPNLAFGHYVRGHIAVLEGRDGEALASFKRAARLDFDLVDADRQVRLLELKKRRSAPSHSDATFEESAPKDEEPIPTMEDLLAGSETTEPEPIASLPPAAAVVVASTPEPAAPAPVTPSPAIDSDPAYALPTTTQPPPARRGWLPFAIGAVVLLAVGAGAASLLIHRAPQPVTTSSTTALVATSTTPSPSVSATTTASVSATAVASIAPSSSAAATTSAVSALTASASPQPSASAAPSATTVATTASAGTDGTIEAPAPGAKGHRVLVDGRSVGDAPGPFTVRCGTHTVQIGSHGKEQKISVPCGGSVVVQP